MEKQQKQSQRKELTLKHSQSNVGLFFYKLNAPPKKRRKQQQQQFTRTIQTE